MIKGIDVSRFQGMIYWDKVKADGIGYAIIKAGGSDDGFYTDSAFERNYAGAKAAGVPVGAYYYVGRLCISREDGIADAKRFLGMLEASSLSIRYTSTSKRQHRRTRQEQQTLLSDSARLWKPPDITAVSMPRISPDSRTVSN